VASNAGKLIEDYFWHVGQYDEWKQRFYVGDANDALKQGEWMRHHEFRATDAWKQLHMIWDRVVFVDGTPYKIERDADDWTKLIVEAEREVVA
jgi:hypothetical protein